MNNDKADGATTVAANKAVSLKYTIFPNSGLSNCVLALILDEGQPCDESLLSESEKLQSMSKSHPNVYRNWFFSRVAAKEATALIWGLDAFSLEVRNRKDGAPEVYELLKNNDKSLGYISLSHCNGASAALASKKPVGIDIERCDRHFKEKLAALAFSPEEQTLVNAKPQELEWPGYLSLWCAKEAAGKCWGVGLLNHLSRIRVTSVDWSDALITVNWVDDSKNKALVKLIKYKQYLLALAVEG